MFLSSAFIFIVSAADTTAPVVSLVSPGNNTKTNSNSFTCNISDETQIANLSIYVWNSSALVYNSTTSFSGLSSSGSWTVSFPGNGNYKWNCLGYDNSSNPSWSALKNYSVVYDTTAPVITINYPGNTNISSWRIQINITANDTLAGLNYTNISIYNNLGIVNSTVNYNAGNSSVYLYVNGDGAYSINTTSYDNASNLNTSSVSVLVDTTPPVFSAVSVYSVVNHSFSYSLPVSDANSRISFYNLTNWTNSFSVNSSTGIVANISALNITKEYYLNISVNDSIGNVNYTLFLINVTNDVYAPAVNLISPTDVYSSTSGSVSFIFNVTDDSVSNCSLVYDGVVLNFYSSVDITGGSISYDKTAAVGSHSWYVSCTDIYGNSRTTSTRSLTITSTDTSGNANSGSNFLTSMPAVYAPSDSQLKNGYSQKLGVGDYYLFKLENVSHKVLVKSITASQATLTVSSNSTDVAVDVNGIKKVDVDGDKMYELSLKYEYVSSQKALITVKSISELVPVQVALVNSNQTSNQTSDLVAQNVSNEVSQQKSGFKFPAFSFTGFSSLIPASFNSSYVLWIVVGMVLVIVVFVVIIFAAKRKRAPSFNEKHWKM